MRPGQCLGALIGILVLVTAVPGWAASSESASAPAHAVDVHVDFAPVFSLQSGRTWSCCAGGRIQGAALLAVAVSLSTQLTLEGDLGFELSDGALFGGMLRHASTPDALPWLQVSGAMGALVINGSFDTVYLVRAELAAQVHPARHVLLFVAAGPDVSLSNQNGPGYDAEHGWVRGEIALRTRIGVGGTW